jgi:predicted ATPase
MRQLPVGIATFLFTDIEGSTRLLHELGSAYGTVLAEHRRMVREVIAIRGGVEVDTQGDAFFCVFRSPDEALNAAAEIQERHQIGPVHVRIGVHMGTAEVVGDGYVGLDVHRAARICSAAHGGQVLVSRAARDAVHAPLRDLGEYRLKDFDDAVRLYQLGDQDFGPPRTPGVVRLPRPATSLVGRDNDVEVIVVRLGADGTRLAIAVAERIAEDYPDGVLFVDLSPITAADLAWSAIGRALGASGNVRGAIRDGRVLLVLDNLEQVQSVGSSIAELMDGCPNLHILATSRIPLHIAAERTYPVTPLPASDAVALFVDRARAADRDFRPDRSVAEICRRLEGLPLAIELAAARVRVLSASAILRNLDRRLPLLTGGPRDAPARQQTLRAAISWSCDLLEPAEIALFRGVAVFAGGWTLEAALEVCEATLESLVELVDHSLVRRDGERYHMLETIREFGAELLAESGEEASIRDRHANFFHELAVARYAPFEFNMPPFDLLVDETDNVRAALETLVARPSTDAALDIVIAASTEWLTEGRLAEGDQWIERALARSDPTPTERRQLILSTAGEFPRHRGDFARAERLIEESVTMGRRLGLDRAVAADLTDLGSIAMERGDLVLARHRLEEALAMRLSIGLPHGVAHAIAGLAELELREDRPEVAAAHLEEVVAIARRTGAMEGRSTDIGSVGLILLGKARRAMGEIDRAAELFEEGLRVAQRVGVANAIGPGLDGMAAVLVVRGRSRASAALLGATSRLREETGFVDDAAAERATTETVLRGVLGDEGYALAFADGRAMTVEDAIELALGESR